MKCNFKKVLFGLSVSLMLAMAIGSFALSETQTPANTQLETQSVAASNDDTGNFAVSGEGGTVSFVDPVLTIDGGSYTISMEEGVTSNSQRIELKGGATVILDGVIVDDTTDGPAITISGSQDVNILLADGSKNVLKGKAGSSSTNPGAPGIQKTDSASGRLIIGIPENSEGTGELEATGGYYAAGIGGGRQENGSNITISGGKVTANGGVSAAGIGGGSTESASNIKITGGNVIATGGSYAAGIGGGFNGSGSNNSIAGDNVVVIAKNGDASKAALEGFGTIDKGLIFIKQETSGAWSGTMHSNAVKVTASVKFPADLEVGAGKVLTVGSKATLTIAEGTELTNNGTVTVENGATLVNEGTITNNGTLTCNGTITTRTDFYLTDGSKYGDEDYYQTYETNNKVQKYKDLPNPDDTTLLKNNLSSDKFIYWYYLNGSTEVKIDNSKDVEPNQHKFYEKRATAYAVTIPTLENGSVISDVTEAAKDETVTLTVTPAEGYELQENSLKVMAGTTAVTVTKGADGTYTFTMPGAAVTVSAVFELIPTPTPEVIIPVQPDNGNIEVLTQDYKPGDTVIFMVTPNEGYQVKGLPTVQILRQDDVKLLAAKTGNEIGIDVESLGDNKYSFVMPNDSVAISAELELAPTPTPPQPGPEPTPEPTLSLIHI